MNEQEALKRMVMPRQHRPLSPQFLGGVIQIWVTRTCDKGCYGCTQGSNLVKQKSKYSDYITVEQFEEACISLKDYFGVVGVFGGNPAVHPEFEQLCRVLAKHIPFYRRGLWCNKLFGHGAIARRTFNPFVSNLNVHLDRTAYDEFINDWPESFPFGLYQDSRHTPPYVAMKDVLTKPCPNPSCVNGRHRERQEGNAALGIYICPTCEGAGQVYDDEKAWELIAGCDINQKWSAMIGVFRGELRAWFCEMAGAQAMLHQNEPSYPDTGIKVTSCIETYNCDWWQLDRAAFTEQVRKHCHECGIPLRGYGMLSQSGVEGVEKVSKTHLDIYTPKLSTRHVEFVTEISRISPDVITEANDYLGNATK